MRTLKNGAIVWLYMSVFLGLFVGSDACAATERSLLNLQTNGGVSNGPKVASTFTVSKSTYISKIRFFRKLVATG